MKKNMYSVSFWQGHTLSDDSFDYFIFSSICLGIVNSTQLPHNQLALCFGSKEIVRISFDVGHNFVFLKQILNSMTCRKKDR